MAITLGNGTVTPAPIKQAAPGNYIDFTSSATQGWAQQYLPELYEAEVEKYGDRSIGGFLKMVGAEMPMTSDQVVWSEQGRLHLSYSGLTLAADSGTNSGTNVISGLPSGHAIRANQTIVISDGSVTAKAFVSEHNTSGTSITVKAYGAAGLETAGLTAGTGITIFVFGTEFGKGVNGMNEAVAPQFQSYTNKPIILKDFYEISGSDASQIGWVEVTGEAGQSGYLWYLKAEGDTRKRFEDYLEMALVEAEKADGNDDLTEAEGTEGLFAAIKDRGHYDAGVTASNTALADFDAMLKKLDKQGAIEENVIFANRSLSLVIDDMLAAQNSYGAGGTSYGVFNNSEDMALNLGFSGFRRGSYDFYKTDWKYLNDASTRGAVETDGSDTFDIRGVLVPAGTSSVYDQILGKNIKRPFLHVRYRASEADDRRMKSWIVGSVGGAQTSGLDAMQVHYLSERCLVVQAANNFVLFN